MEQHKRANVSVRLASEWRLNHARRGNELHKYALTRTYIVVRPRIQITLRHDRTSGAARLNGKHQRAWKQPTVRVCGSCFRLSTYSRDIGYKITEAIGEANLAEVCKLSDQSNVRLSECQIASTIPHTTYRDRRPALQPLLLAMHRSCTNLASCGRRIQRGNETHQGV